MGDDSACIGQDLQCTVGQSLTIDLSAGRSDDQFYKWSHLFSFQDSCSFLQIFQTTVGTGTDKNLIDLCAGQFFDRFDIVYLRRTGKYRYQILSLISQFSCIHSIRVTRQRFLEVVQLDLTILGGFLIRCEQCTFRARFDGHICHRHPAGNAHVFHGITGEFQRLISSTVSTKIADQTKNDVFGSYIHRKLTVNGDFDGLRNFYPQLTSTQDRSHLGIADTRGKSTHTAVSSSMAVCTKYHIARFNITGLCHQLMADTVTSMYIFHAVFFNEFISLTEMAGIIHLTCRNEVVVDQHDFVRIPELCESHFFEFIRHKGNKDIVDHDSVHVGGNNITGFDIADTGVVFQDFFDNCIAHD